MTRALVALSEGTYGGVYYSANINFADLTTQPTWTKLATTGLANTLIARMQCDPFAPYDDIYVQLENDNIYKWNGASWDLLLTLAQARTQTGVASGLMGYIYVDPTVRGSLYTAIATAGVNTCKMMKSTDYGVTWSVFTIHSGIAAGGAVAAAIGDYVVAEAGSLYTSLHFSENGGSSFTDYNVWPSSGGSEHRTAKINRHNPTQAYFANGPADNNLALVTKTGQTVLQNGYNLYANGTVGGFDGVHWIDPNVANHERIIREGSGSGKFYIYSTTDQWANFVDATPTDLVVSQGIQHGAITAALEDDEFIMFGLTSATGASAGSHFAWGCVGDNPTACYGIDGTNFNTPPYTNAIPSISGAFIARTGIWVGEGITSGGVYVYADEQGDIAAIPDYDNLGAPMFGDRGSWRDRKTDGNDVYHAEDVYRDNREIHAPQPTGIDGYGIVESGGFWINSDDVLALASDVVDSDTLHEHVISEDHTAECNGVTVLFETDIDFRPESTQVYLNGIRQRLTVDYTEAISLDSITMTTAPESGDILLIDYICTYEDGAAMARRVLISEQTPTGTGTVTWSSIPAIYRKLEIEYVARGTGANTATVMYIYFNNDTTATNYRFVKGINYAGGTAGTGGDNNSTIAEIAAANSGAGSAGQGTVQIINYAGTTFNKQAMCECSWRSDTSSGHQAGGNYSVDWESAVAINRVDLVLATGNFDTGSTLRLYGVY